MRPDDQRGPITPPSRRPGPEKPALAAPPAKSGGAKDKSKNKKIPNSLVALGSAAIISVYGLGYLRTQTAQALYNVDAPAVPIATAAPTATDAASSQVAAYQSPLFTPTATAAPAIVASATATTAPATATTSPTVTSAPAASIATVPATATPTASAATTATYKDGTYTGTGTSRHGSITAAVVIQGGKIVSAEITQCGTRYPCAKIAALPGEVVARQSSAVDLVSGATDSSQAYQGAIVNALAKAKVAA